jgi:prepilin-type N-terminal cleavage/methylation domain-containing protein
MPATYVQRRALRGRTAARLSVSRPGFTLIEILVVVVILGIAAACIVPHIGSRSDLKATSAARLMMADLIYVQNRSISTQTWHYVQFDPATGSYKVLDKMLPTQNVILHPVEQSPFVVAIGPSGPPPLRDVKIDSASFDGQKVLAFDEMGTPYAYNPSTGVPTAMTAGTIGLKCKDMLLKVIIEPFTGELRLGPITLVP